MSIIEVILYREPIEQIAALVPEERFVVKAKTLAQAINFYGKELLNILTKDNLLEVHAWTPRELQFVERHNLRCCDHEGDCCSTDEQDVFYHLRKRHIFPLWVRTIVRENPVLLEIMIKERAGAYKILDVIGSKKLILREEIAILAASYYGNKLGTIWSTQKSETLEAIGIRALVPNKECFCCLGDLDKRVSTLYCGHDIHTRCSIGQTELRCFCGVKSELVKGKWLGAVPKELTEEPPLSEERLAELLEELRLPEELPGEHFPVEHFPEEQFPGERLFGGLVSGEFHLGDLFLM